MKENYPNSAELRRQWQWQWKAYNKNFTATQYCICIRILWVKVECVARPSHPFILHGISVRNWSARWVSWKMEYNANVSNQYGVIFKVIQVCVNHLYKHYGNYQPRRYCFPEVTGNSYSISTCVFLWWMWEAFTPSVITQSHHTNWLITEWRWWVWKLAAFLRRTHGRSRLDRSNGRRSSNEPGELWQWLWLDDSAVKITILLPLLRK